MWNWAHKVVCVKFKEHLGVLGAGSNIIQMAEFLAHFSNVFAWSFFFFSPDCFPK